MGVDPKQTHTPGPIWADEDGVFIFDAKTRMIAEMRGDGHLTPEQIKENASRFVRCVNSHETLVEALEYLLDTYRKNYDEGETTPAIRKAEAALRTVRGE